MVESRFNGISNGGDMEIGVDGVVGTKPGKTEITCF